ncbi:MAG TPA: hypothetical protein VMI75_15335 [Polyangiaceae bacterium]|nr:hypothetical protein [Polyangiaceae bacterium]
MCSRSERAPTLVAAALGAVGFLTTGADARAADRKGQVVAVVVEGPHADQVAGWLEDRVVAPNTLKEGDAFRTALRAKGAPALHAAAGNDARDAQLVARASAAARDAGVDHAILVDVRPTPRATRVHVWHIDAQRSQAVVDTDVTLPPSASAMYTTRAVLALAPPAEAAPAEPTRTESIAPAASPAPAASAASPIPDAPPQLPETAAVEADRAPTAPSPEVDSSLLSVRASIGAGMRHFSYVDRITPSLRPYDLAAAPVAVATGVVYPLSPTHIPVLRDFGITGEYSQAFALASQDSAGNRVGTTWQAFDFGATERIALPRGLLANVSAGYGGNDYQFTDAIPGGAAALPSVSYRFVRVGADLRYGFLSAFAAWVGGSYLDVLSSGYTAQLFPRETVGGVEAHLGASWRLAKSWELSLSGAYTRFFYSFNPVPGDASVAGGALDEQTRVLAGFAYVM